MCKRYHGERNHELLFEDMIMLFIYTVWVYWWIPIFVGFKVMIYWQILTGIPGQEAFRKDPGCSNPIKNILIYLFKNTFFFIMFKSIFGKFKR